MSLLPPRRALVGAGLLLCAFAPAARAQNEAPAALPAAPPMNAAVANNAATVGDAAESATTGTATKVGAQIKAMAPPTPDERRQQTEDKLRELMKNLGINGAAAQDAIIEYLAGDEMSRVARREAENRLLMGLRRDVPPERMRDLLADYRAAIETDKADRALAQRRLDARVGYSLDPKVEAILWLMGVLGEGASKLPTSALTIAKPPAPEPQVAEPAKPPLYGPLLDPNLGARGEIVGTVIAKGVGDDGGHWLEIRDDSGATDRYAAPRRDEAQTPDAEMEKLLAQTQLNARVRVQWIWQERRRALKLQVQE